MKQLLLHIVIVLLVLLLPIFSVSAEDYNDVESENIVLGPASQFLYHFLLIEITSDGFAELGLSELKSNMDIDDSNFTLISRNSIFKIGDKNWEAEIINYQKGRRDALVLGSQVVVVPGKTGFISLENREIISDGGSSKTDNYNSFFSLEVSPDREIEDYKNGVKSRIMVSLEEGLTGIDTEVLLLPDEPHLLGMIKSTTLSEENKLFGEKTYKDRRYFAIYTVVSPIVGIYNIPELSENISGLEELFQSGQYNEDNNHLILAANKSNSELDYSLSSAYYPDEDLKLLLDINNIPTGENKLSLLKPVYDQFWVGSELIYDNNGWSTSLTFIDTLEIGAIKLNAAVNPLVYNFDSGLDKVSYYLQSETQISSRLKFSLSYYDRGDENYTEAIIGHKITSANYLLLGYVQDLYEEEKDGFWIGLEIEM
ncbi:MAG: hypothetical protein ACLFPF_03850 [Halanaerobiales bacterium]